MPDLKEIQTIWKLYPDSCFSWWSVWIRISLKFQARIFLPFLSQVSYLIEKKFWISCISCKILIGHDGSIKNLVFLFSRQESFCLFSHKNLVWNTCLKRNLSDPSRKTRIWPECSQEVRLVTVQYFMNLRCIF